MKRLSALIAMAIVACMAVFALAGCGAGQEKKPAENTTVAPAAQTKPEPAKKKVVVATTSFLQDMVKQIAGDTVEIQQIIPAGEDPHLYQAKAEDHDKIKNADLVLYHGLHFEGKMGDILEPRGHAISKDFPQDKIGKMEEDGEMIIDPHFWFDLDLYKMGVLEAAKQLENLNPELKDQYKAAAEKYNKDLDELDKYVRAKMEEIPKERRILITPHDAFNYFSRRYDVQVKAPQGVSTDSETSVQDIQETVDFIVKNKVKAVFAESTTDPARMRNLQEACKQKGQEVTVVEGEGKELFSDSLSTEGPATTFIGMYKSNVDLMNKYLK